MLVIKTREELFEKVSEEVKGLHPYEVPEIVAVKANNVNKPYMDWVIENTTPKPT